MLKQIAITLGFPEGERVNSSMGSIFHGAIMSLLPTEYVTELHQQGSRPFSQYVFWDRELQQPVWHINIFESKADAELTARLMNLDKLFLEQKDYSVLLKEISIKKSSYEELADGVFLSEQAPRGVRLTFNTATSFKHNGQYMIFPDSRMIIQSLLNRWNQFSPQFKLEESQLKEKLANMCYVKRYNLHSQVFSVEQSNICGFAGTLDISFKAPDAQRRILGLIFSFAEFAGVGIKTALGMGGTRIELAY